ncbi:hypothetical protein ABZ356_25485 [Micromonospora zamorensis]|uniref:hypothetical protein n=1 Tax=Micromonospora zamorensis TaxID=709883 RepID=UPI0033DAA9BB
MYGLTEQQLTEIGRITVAASHLEAALCTLSVRILSVPFFDTLGRTGEALRAARRALCEMQDIDRKSVEPYVDAAERLLGERHKLIHALWMEAGTLDGRPVVVGYHHRSATQTPAEAPLVYTLAPAMAGLATQLVGVVMQRFPPLTPPFPPYDSEPQ